MIGDKIEGRIRWYEWLGGRDGGGQLRTCLGAIEHVGTGWILIRRPRGGLMLKRLTRAVLRGGRIRLEATDTDDDVLARWLSEDDATRHAKAERMAAARVRRAEREAAFWEQPSGGSDQDLPF